MNELDILVDIRPDGKIADKHHRDLVIRHLSFRAKGKARIRIGDESRSVAQNKMLWWMYGRILDAMGEAGHRPTSEKLHTFFKEIFIVGEPVEVFGKTIIHRTTTTMSKKVFTDFIENIRSHQDVIEMGVVFEDREIDEQRARWRV